MALTAGLMINGSAFAADVVAGPAPDMEALFQEVEKRVAENHMISPPGDSALDAWGQVMAVVPGTEPVRLDKALTAFAARMRQDAEEQNTAGKNTLAAEFSLFASQAEGLKADILSSAAKASPPPRSEALAPNTTPVMPCAATSPAVVPPGRSPAEFYGWCGDQLLQAARTYYEYAEKAGSTRATAQLAKINEIAAVPRPAPVHSYHRHPRPRTLQKARTVQTLGELY